MATVALLRVLFQRALSGFRGELDFTILLSTKG